MSQVDANKAGEDFYTRFNRAVTLAQAGNKTQAYQDLKVLARENGAKDVNLLLWIAFTSPDLNEAQTAIRMAESQSPANPSITAAKQWLRQEKLKSPAAYSTTTPESKPATNDSGFQPAPSEFRQPGQVFKAAPTPQHQAGPNSWVNPKEPEPFPMQSSPVPGKKNLSTLTLLTIALGVLVVLLIAWAVFYFTSNPTTALSDTVFDKAGLPVFSELEKLELSQTLKDQLSTYYTSAEFAKSGVKVTQVDVYKIKTTSSGGDFNKFYRSELDKGGWNIQSVPVTPVSQQPFLVGIKSHAYILLGTAIPGKSASASELTSQLAPNQFIAFAMLFEQNQPNS